MPTPLQDNTLRRISVVRGCANGEYDDVIDFVNTLLGKHGSAPRAVVYIIRRCAAYKAWRQNRQDPHTPNPSEERNPHVQIMAQKQETSAPGASNGPTAPR